MKGRNKPRAFSSGALSISSYFRNFALFFEAKTEKSEKYKMHFATSAEKIMKHRCKRIKVEIIPLVIAEVRVVFP